MKNKIHDLAEWSIKTAKSAGADDCRVSINAERSVEISYRERKPENIKEASQKGLTVEVFVNGKYSNQSTSDLRDGALKEFITNAVASTKLLAADPFRSLPDPKYYKDRAATDLKTVDPSYDKFAAKERHELVKIVEDACLGEGGKKVISVVAEEGDGYGESVMVSSNGFDGSQESTYYYAGAQMTAQDEGDRRPSGYHYLESIDRSIFRNPKEIGYETARRTLRRLGGKKKKQRLSPSSLKTGPFPEFSMDCWQG